jgi:hypothetical protein
VVKQDRARKTREVFEDKLRAILAEENSKVRKTKVDEEDNGEEVVYPAHDFADVVSGGNKTHVDSNDDATDDEEGNDDELQLQEEEDEDNNDESDEEDGEPEIDYTSEQNTHHSDDDDDEQNIEDDF